VIVGGVDEAGRGPVIGPMVMVLAIASEEKIGELREPTEDELALREMKRELDRMMPGMGKVFRQMQKELERMMPGMVSMLEQVSVQPPKNGAAFRGVRIVIGPDGVPRVTEYLTRMLIELDDRESREYLAEFMGYVNNLIFAKGIDEELRTILVDAFDSIWKFIATKMYYDDMRKYYSDAQLGRIAADLEQRRAEMIDSLSLLRDAAMEFVPKPPEDEELEELKSLSCN